MSKSSKRAAAAVSDSQVREELAAFHGEIESLLDMVTGRSAALQQEWTKLESKRRQLQEIEQDALERVETLVRRTEEAAERAMDERGKAEAAREDVLSKVDEVARRVREGEALVESFQHTLGSLARDDHVRNLLAALEDGASRYRTAREECEALLQEWGARLVGAADSVSQRLGGAVEAQSRLDARADELDHRCSQAAEQLREGAEQAARELRALAGQQIACAEAQAHRCAAHAETTLHARSETSDLLTLARQLPEQLARRHQELVGELEDHLKRAREELDARIRERDVPLGHAHARLGGLEERLNRLEEVCVERSRVDAGRVETLGTALVRIGAQLEALEKRIGVSEEAFTLLRSQAATPQETAAGVQLEESLSGLRQEYKAKIRRLIEQLNERLPIIDRAINTHAARLTALEHRGG